jgi:hypothetical protein
MIPQIAKALSSGFTADQVIKFILKKFPDQADKIKSAMAAGFTVDQILNYIQGGRKLVNQSQNQEMQMQGRKTEHEQTRDMDTARKSNVNKGFGTAAALGASALGGPAALQALSRALPANLAQLAPAILQQQQSPLSSSSTPNQNPLPENPTNIGQPSQPSIPSEIPSSPNPPVPPSLPQGNAIAQPKGIPNAKEYLDKLGVTAKVDEEIAKGNSPEGIMAMLTIGNKKAAKTDPELKSAIEEYVKQKIREDVLNPPGSTPDLEKKTPNVKPLDNAQQEKKALPGEKTTEVQRRLKIGYADAAKLVDERDKLEKQPTSSEVTPEKQPIAKTDTVATPQGIGNIKAIKEKTALVEVGGKTHKIPIEELEKPSFSEDEVADAYDNLMAKIPEEHRSGFIQWAGYDEDRNVLGFIPRAGKYEELHNITPEEANLIKEGKGVARTSGENREGLWVVGEDTRGGIISQIIHDRRKKNKANDEKQLKLGFELPKPEKEDKGMKPLFDELAYARNLSREREKKAKLEERAKKKKEKDEAKKRKK